MIIKSKQILTATLIIALAAAVGVNWYYTENPYYQEEYDTSYEQVSGNLGDSLYVAGTTVSETTTSAAENEDSQEYFAQAKIKRSQSHDEVIDKINSIAEKQGLEKAEKDKLILLAEDFSSLVKAESDTENIIKAKTGAQCLVIINEGNCQVIMEKNTLNDRIILQITEIIQKNTDISSENLTIIEIK